MSLHDQQPKLINTCIAYTRYLDELSSYRRLAKCFSESILKPRKLIITCFYSFTLFTRKNNKGLVMKNGYKWAVLDLYFIRSTTVVHCQLIPLLTMYEDIIRLLLEKSWKVQRTPFQQPPIKFRTKFSKVEPLNITSRKRRPFHFLKARSLIFSSLEIGEKIMHE